MVLLSPGTKLNYIFNNHCFDPVLINRVRLISRCTSASVIPSISFLPAIFIERLVTGAAEGEVNKMSEEMLSFIVSIMHNTPSL